VLRAGRADHRPAPARQQILLNALHQLGDKGNTLVVVEHDEDTIRRADHIIDIGPGAGKRGGRLVAQGTAAELALQPDSVTGRCLAHPLVHPLQARREVTRATPALELRGAHLHNLQQVDVDVPLGRLVAVTGVSGSGKSTLARDVLLANVAALVAAKGRKNDEAAAQSVILQGCKSLSGWGGVDRVLEVDQTPIGKTPRSCPATYIGFWDAIRKLFAETLEAKARGYAAAASPSTPARAAARPARAGHAHHRDELPARCEGALRRLPRPALQPRDAGRDLARQEHRRRAEDGGGRGGGVLRQHAVHRPPAAAAQGRGPGLPDPGPAQPTLSGGEAQRIKLVTELTKVRDEVGRRGQKAPHTLYVLDEPTVGLHMADVER
jgi:excinuclease ABC subunit A